MKVFYVKEKSNWQVDKEGITTEEFINQTSELVDHFNSNNGKETDVKTGFPFLDSQMPVLLKSKIPFPFELKFIIESINDYEVILHYYLEVDEQYKDKAIIWKLSQ